MKRKLITLVCMMAAVLVSTTKTSAGSSDPEAVAADAVVARPLLFAATIVGSAIFVVSLPVAATSHSIHSTAEALVLGPARATFTRPLGDFDYATPDGVTARHHKQHPLRAEKAKPRK